MPSTRQSAGAVCAGAIIMVQSTHRQEGQEGGRDWILKGFERPSGREMKMRMKDFQPGQAMIRFLQGF